MSRKLLSIITVTKNCAQTIERTFVSVKAVKNEDVEYIVVDGVSDDGTLDIVNKHLSIIDQFVCEPDTGIYQAMNKGVARANGEYILFINGGDELIANGIKEVLDTLRTTHEQIVCATTVVVDSAAKHNFSFTPTPKRLIYGDSLPHPSSFVRRDLISNLPFREDLRIASDYDFFLKTFLLGTNFKIIDCQTALHYLGGVSSNNRIRKKEVDLILRSHLGWRQMYYHKIVNVFVWITRKITNRLRCKMA